VAELLKFVQKFNMAAVRHLELLFGYPGPPTKFLVDLKLVFKFRVDRIYICEDISDQTFRKFGFKRLFAPTKFTF